MTTDRIPKRMFEKYQAVETAAKQTKPTVRRVNNSLVHAGGLRFCSSGFNRQILLNFTRRLKPPETFKT
jgi:hypothetical protein